MSKQDYYHWMQKAITLAQKAEEQGEVPVGALLIDEHNNLIAESYNQPISLNDPTAHAEILCLREAGKKLNNYRLNNTTLFVTLEPCPMCATAIVHARVKEVVFGAYDVKQGACGSTINILNHSALNHKVMVTGGIEEVTCQDILRAFFKTQRDS